MRVLLVEDNDDHVVLVRETLAGSIADLVCVDRLSRALDLLAEGGIDAVLLDLSLPDSKGLDTVTRMRAQAPGVPFVVLTVLDDESVGLQAVQFGAQDYLVKTRLDRDLLLRSLRYAVERKQADGRRAAEHDVARVLAESANSAEAAPKIVRAMCEALGWDFGALWREDRERQALSCLGCWHRPGLDVGDFEAVTRVVTFPAGVGLPGRVLASGHPVWVSDVANEVNFLRTRFAAAASLHAAVAFPLLFEGRLWGVLEFFSRKIQEPDPELLEMIKAVAAQVGQFMVRHKAEEALEHQRRLLQMVVDNMAEGLVVTDANGKFLLFNAAAAQILGIGMTSAPPQQWPERYGLYRPDGVSPFPAEELPLVQAMGGEAVDGAELFVRNSQRVNGVWVSVNARPLRDQSGAVAGGVAVFHDVTEQKEGERRRAELRAAQEIQRQLFPAAPPELPGFDLAGASYPADETSGDCFDYLPLPDGRLGIVVGDVSGHGLGPALLMAETRAFLRALAQTHADAGAVLGLANRMVTEDVSESRFVTVFFGQLDPRTRSFTYSSAGHRCYLLRAGGEVHRLESTGAPLGLERDSAIPSETVALAPGDLVLLPSDGLLEARSAGGIFGIDRALRVVAEHRHEPARQLVDRLYREVREFSGRPQEDDITVVILKVEAPAASPFSPAAGPVPAQG